LIECGGPAEKRARVGMCVRQHFSALIFLVLFAPDSYREAKTNKEKKQQISLAINAQHCTRSPVNQKSFL
jgi:hypothetical protein